MPKRLRSVFTAEEKARAKEITYGGKSPQAARKSAKTGKPHGKASDYPDAIAKGLDGDTYWSKPFGKNWRWVCIVRKAGRSPARSAGRSTGARRKNSPKRSAGRK